jgi:hypothetical protein
MAFEMVKNTNAPGLTTKTVTAAKNAIHEVRFMVILSYNRSKPRTRSQSVMAASNASSSTSAAFV